MIIIKQVSIRRWPTSSFFPSLTDSVSRKRCSQDVQVGIEFDQFPL